MGIKSVCEMRPEEIGALIADAPDVISDEQLRQIVRRQEAVHQKSGRMIDAGTEGASGMSEH